MNTESNAAQKPRRAASRNSDHVRRPGRSTGRCGANYGRTARSTWRRSIAAGVVLFGFGIRRSVCRNSGCNALALESTRQRAAIEMPYDIAAMMIMFTVFIVGIFYCLDALHGERRDRSILFWKSLPVSDLTTVLSKVFVPLVILPVLTFAIIDRDAAYHAVTQHCSPAPERPGRQRLGIFCPGPGCR